MITVKTMKQIPTSRTIPSFRSGRSACRPSCIAVDQSRMINGYAQMVCCEVHRQWLNRARQTVFHL